MNLAQGFIDAMPAADYHAMPALSKSGVGALVDECPHAYWWDSPFNPDHVEENKRSFDIGTAAHLMMLEPEDFAKRTVLIPFDSYRKGEAQELRDEAYQFGLTPLLTHEVEMLGEMRLALLTHPLAKDAFRTGYAERSHVWQDSETGVWCKCRPDFQSVDGAYVVDYKTAASANPRDFGRSIRDHYYFVQQPWYLDGIKATTGATPSFLFVVQEKVAPYRVSVMQLAEDDVERGRIYARKARHVFAACQARGEWPGYTDKRVATVTLPTGFQYEFATREECGEFAVTAPAKKPRSTSKNRHISAEEFAI